MLYERIKPITFSITTSISSFTARQITRNERPFCRIIIIIIIREINVTIIIAISIKLARSSPVSFMYPR